MKVSDTMKEIVLKVANEEGWFRQQENERINEELRKVAKNFLLRGRPVDEVAEATGLPIDIVEALA